MQGDPHQTGFQVPRILGAASVCQRRAAAKPAAAITAMSAMRARREDIGGV